MNLILFIYLLLIIACVIIKHGCIIIIQTFKVKKNKNQETISIISSHLSIIDIIASSGYN